MNGLDTYFYKSQCDWINDDSPLKIAVKSRQIGFSYCNAFRLVTLVSAKHARLDAFISSRDQFQARLQLEDCLHWARILHLAATDLGQILFDDATNSSAYVLQFANGRRIYSLSSNPNALAGKRGHVTLDEFALHQDQRLLYRVAKPVTTWGGQLSIISTHRGTGTLFYQLIRDITENRNPMGWSFHSVPIQKAVAEGIVERINKKLGHASSPSPGGEGWGEGGISSVPPSSPEEKGLSDGLLLRASSPSPGGEGRGEGGIFCAASPSSSGEGETPSQSDLRSAFLQRLRAECIDEEQWLQEYCCIPADESAAFFPYELLDACTDPSLKLLTLNELPDSALRTPHSAFYLGLDLARHHNLCVLDLGEKIDNVIHDRLRLELRDQSFTQIEAQLYPLLRLPQLKRACIDNTGMGAQLAEQARERFGWKVEPVTFTPARKEELAFALRRDFEDRKLRISGDDQLRADLRALKKEITPTGKLRLIGDVENSHCDRTWAKALRQHAARHRPSAGAIVI